MASEPIRDPIKDRLLTPKNAAFVIIDYQPVQVNSIASIIPPPPPLVPAENHPGNGSWRS